MNRITVHPDICHGKPVVRNMRYPVSMILELLAGGMTTEEIIEDYPALEKEDIAACLSFAAQLSDVKSISKLIAA